MTIQSRNILDDHQVKLVEANQQLLRELLADKMSTIKKIESLSILVDNAQVLKNLDHQVLKGLDCLFTASVCRVFHIQTRIPFQIRFYNNH